MVSSGIPWYGLQLVIGCNKRNSGGRNWEASKWYIGRFKLAFWTWLSHCTGVCVCVCVSYLLTVCVFVCFRCKGSENMCAKFCPKCCICCLWCLEKCMKYLSQNAYTIIGVHDVCFVTSQGDKKPTYFMAIILWQCFVVESGRVFGMWRISVQNCETHTHTHTPF